VDYSIRLNSRIGQSAFPARCANQVRIPDRLISFAGWITQSGLTAALVNQAFPARCANQVRIPDRLISFAGWITQSGLTAALVNQLSLPDALIKFAYLIG